MTQPLAIPTVHLNGTPKRMLVDALMVAIIATETAYQAVKQTAPNVRDWYPQGAAALDVATAQHSARLAKLVEVNDELSALALAIEAR